MTWTIDAGWLKALVSHAVRPEIDIVGAKLLFPNGRIQHAGVVLGMGGIAGHTYRRCSADEPGYLQQAKVPPEVVAVTAACVALQRAKFERVGGFDADNFAIDLNDTDLYLKMAERGWTNPWTPESVLTHVQSASRGIERDPFQQYRRERGYFLKRWVEAIRDDLYFHPEFALHSQNSGLGLCEASVQYLARIALSKNCFEIVIGRTHVR